MDIAALPMAAALGPLSRESSPHWRPGLFDDVLHGEAFAPLSDASGAGAALAFALDRMHSLGTDPLQRRALLWVQDKAALRRSGRPYRHGLPRALRENLVHVAAERPEDALFALEEGLRCRDLCCVIGEIAGNPKALDFTASRRLSLAAEKHGVPLWLVRLDAQRDLSSARMRWDIRSAPSPAPRWNAGAPGMPSWQAELLRARTQRQGKWILSDDGECLVARRELAAGATPDHGDLARDAGD